jgi:proteasome lid subunit RPN8/RPN11
MMVPEMSLTLPGALKAEIARQARMAFPAECCGLIAGTGESGQFRAMALHPARNLASRPDRFEIDPKDQIAAVKEARRSGGRIIGCYHSHPNGEARPSAHDLAEAAEEDFLWLIAATDGEDCRLQGYLYRESAFSELALIPLGADCVASSGKERG